MKETLVESLRILAPVASALAAVAIFFALRAHQTPDSAWGLSPVAAAVCACGVIVGGLLYRSTSKVGRVALWMCAIPALGVVLTCLAEAIMPGGHPSLSVTIFVICGGCYTVLLFAIVPLLLIAGFAGDVTLVILGLSLNAFFFIIYSPLGIR